MEHALDTDDAAALIAHALSLEDDPRSIRAIAELLAAAGGSHALWSCGPEVLAGLLDRDRALRLESILALASRLVAPPLPTAPIEGPEAVAAYFRPRLAADAVESFWVLALDARGHALSAHRVAVGTLTLCLVHPREIFAIAIRARAASIVLVHNHPSGDPQPSEEDEELTRRLVAAGDLVGIPVVDHVVVARAGFRSIGVIEAMAERRHALAGGARAGDRTWRPRSRRVTLGAKS